MVNFENTPKLYFVHPKSMHPDSVVTWKGDFNTNDKKDIEPLLIGDTRCHRFEEEKKADDDDYIHKSGGTLRCKVSSDISAGFYGIRAKN